MDPTKLPAPTFVNNLAFSGFLNGIVNLAFSAARWYPIPDEANPGKLKISGTDIIDLDLRIDLLCAQQLRDALDTIIEQNTKPKTMDS